MVVGTLELPPDCAMATARSGMRPNVLLFSAATAAASALLQICAICDGGCKVGGVTPLQCTVAIDQ